MPDLAFEPIDLQRHRQVTALDGTRAHDEAVCSVKHVEPAEDGYLSALWILDASGERAPQQLTAGIALDTQPAWSPDGRRIAFLSDRQGGPPQLHVIERAGGEARLVCELAQGVQTFAWHPDGERLIAIVTVAVDPDAHGREGDAPPRDRGPDAPEVVWRLPYKLDGLGYTLAERAHLYGINVASGEAAPLTQGDFEVRGFDVSPDGRQIVYVRTREEAHHCTDLWLMPSAGGEARRLTFDQATASAPAWSPDGRCIVYAGACDAGDAQLRLWRLDLPDGRVQGLGGEDVEAVPGSKPCWTPDGRAFDCVLARRGLQQVARVPLDGGPCSVLVQGERHVERVTATANRLVYTAVSPASPQEVMSTDREGLHERVLSAFNAWWRDRPAPLVLWRRFTVPDGEGGEENIDGWLMLPAGHREGRLPLLVDVHGGPASYVLLNHQAHPHWPILCQRGWAVLALNCVGSSSYGHAFSARLRARWGELDLDQHLAAVKTLQREGLASDRVAILGKSYGGFMSAWAIGKTDVFRCAVVMAPVGNLETHYGTSDSGYYADPYSMCGEPYVNREVSRKLSPMQYVQQTRTPTLFLQGKEDERCPKCQSEELYVTIARASRTPVEMVLYPGGSHHFWEDGRPSHRLDALQRVLAWLTRWIDVPLATRASPAPHAQPIGMPVAGSPGRQIGRHSIQEIEMTQQQDRNQQGQQQEQQGGSQNQQGGGSRSGQQQQGGNQQNQQGGQQQPSQQQDRNQQQDQNRQERR